MRNIETKRSGEAIEMSFLPFHTAYLLYSSKTFRLDFITSEEYILFKFSEYRIVESQETLMKSY